jgi:hypothetical protein
MRRPIYSSNLSLTYNYSVGRASVPAKRVALYLAGAEARPYRMIFNLRLAYTICIGIRMQRYSPPSSVVTGRTTPGFKGSVSSR